MSLAYNPFEHFTLTGTGGYYMPGRYITEFSTDEFGTDFDEPAVGGRLVGAIEF